MIFTVEHELTETKIWENGRVIATLPQAWLEDILTLLIRSASRNNQIKLTRAVIKGLPDGVLKEAVS